VSFAVALATATALAILRHFAFCHVTAALAILHALAVFAAIHFAGAAIGFRHLSVSLACALGIAAALPTAGTLSVFAAALAVRTRAGSLLVIAFRRSGRSRRLSNHAHGKYQRHQQHFQFHIDLHKSCCTSKLIHAPYYDAVRE
jgi:hypothetical protein